MVDSITTVAESGAVFRLKLNTNSGATSSGIVYNDSKTVPTHTANYTHLRNENFNGASKREVDLRA